MVLSALHSTTRIVPSYPLSCASTRTSSECTRALRVFEKLAASHIQGQPSDMAQRHLVTGHCERWLSMERSECGLNAGRGVVTYTPDRLHIPVCAIRLLMTSVGVVPHVESARV